MNKLLYILFSVFLLTACSSDDDITPTTEPETGDDMTIEQIVGTYELSDSRYSDGLERPIGTRIILTFKENNIIEEFDPGTLEVKQYTWKYNNKIITFSTTKHGNVSGWFNNSYLKYKARYSSSDTTIGTYTYAKKK